MKYKVIGWTFSDNYDIENAPLSFAARHAIVDEIKTKGYLFSGYEHQEAWYGCPVLNDGKKRMCSQRGFAGIMAEAHGEIDLYAYSKYMFGIKKEAIIAPKATINKTAIELYCIGSTWYTYNVNEDTFVQTDVFDTEYPFVTACDTAKNLFSSMKDMYLLTSYNEDEGVYYWGDDEFSCYLTIEDKKVTSLTYTFVIEGQTDVYYYSLSNYGTTSFTVPFELP